MKRKLLVLFFFVMLMTAACNVSDEKNSSEETPFSNEEYVCIDSFRQGFLTEEYALYHGDESQLRLFDVASQTDIAFCFEPNCEHEQEKRLRTGELLQEGCISYAFSRYTVMLRGDSCFFFDYDTSEVFQSNRQGKDRKMIGQIPQYILPSRVFFSKDSVFVSYASPYEMIEAKDNNGETYWIVGETKPKNKCGVVRLNLNNGEYSELLETEDYAAQIMEYDVRGDHLYFQRSYSDIPYISPDLETDDPSLIPEGMTVENYWEELPKHMWMDIYDFSLSTGELKVVLQHQHYGAMEFCKDFFAVEEGQTTGLYRYSGERFRELDFPMSVGVRSDSGLVCQKGNDYVLVDENSGEILSKSTISTEDFVPHAILGQSCYGLFHKDNQWVPAYISAEDFWNGDVTKVIPFMGQ